ncbi:MAG: trigger factor [Bacilli bacterium]
MEKEVNIKVEGKEWETALEKAFENANKKVKIDGFRTGKAPKEMFFKKYGKEALYRDAADLVLDSAYTKMLEDNIGLEIVVQPDMKIKSIDEKAIEFVFVLTTKPPLKLGKYKNLGVKKDKIEVTKEEINSEIEHMRSHYAESILKEDAIENGDTAIIDFEGFKDEVAFPGGKAENYSLKIGSNSFIPGFEEQLIGMKTNDEKDITVTFPEDYHEESLKGAKVIFKIKIHEVKATVIPAISKEFFDDLGLEGIDTLEKLEVQVKENITLKKEADTDDKYIDDLLEAVAKNVEVDIPSVMINEEVKRMLKQYEQKLSMQGLTLKQFYQYTNSDQEALEKQMEPEALSRVKYRLILEEIAKEEKIEITDKEAKEESKNLALKYQIEEEEFLKSFGGLDMIKYDLKMRKAIETLKD